MVGLIDLDLQTNESTSLCPPNLEIMKLATYYKIEENKFCRLIGLNETDLTGYEAIYCFSEQPQMPEIPIHLKRTNEIVFGGTAFTNGVYHPFQNEIIDYTLPRPVIYKEYLKEKYQAGIKTKVIEHILDDTYYRFYAGEAQLPLPAVRPKQRFFLYDKDFFQPGWEALAQEIQERKASSLITIHPIVCKTLTQFFQIRKMPIIARTNDIILDLHIPLKEVQYMFNHYLSYFLAEVGQNPNIYIPFGGNLKSNRLFYTDLLNKLNLLYAFWSKGLNLKLKFQPPQIGIINPICLLSKKVEKWSASKTGKKTIIEAVRAPKSAKKGYVTPEHQELLDMLKYYPKEQTLFEQTHIGISERRYWRL